jgi:hypothetical protein
VSEQPLAQQTALSLRTGSEQYDAFPPFFSFALGRVGDDTDVAMSGILLACLECVRPLLVVAQVRGHKQQKVRVRQAFPFFL